jgi:hypothetical protein
VQPESFGVERAFPSLAQLSGCRVAVLDLRALPCEKPEIAEALAD